jgi:chitinase
VTSTTAIVQQYGFDGISVDVENPSLVLEPGDADVQHPATPTIVNLIAALQQLKSQLGANFNDYRSAGTGYSAGWILSL